MGKDREELVATNPPLFKAVGFLMYRIALTNGEKRQIS